MSIGVVIKHERVARGERQTRVAAVTGIERTTLSKIENGKLRDPQMLQILANHFDCPRIYKELHEALASMVFVHRWLDGDIVDLHRSSVRAKALEELHEAIEALKGFDLVNRPVNVTDEDRERLINELLFPLLGAEGAIETAISVLCQEYGISPAEVYSRWNKRMEQMGYYKRGER